MAHRIQITLSDAQYAFLDEEADRSSLSIAELVRRAVDTTYVLAGPRHVTVIQHTLGRRAGRSIDRDPPRRERIARWHERVVRSFSARRSRRTV